MEWRLGGDGVMLFGAVDGSGIGDGNGNGLNVYTSSKPSGEVDAVDSSLVAGVSPALQDWSVMFEEELELYATQNTNRQDTLSQTTPTPGSRSVSDDESGRTDYLERGKRPRSKKPAREVSVSRRLFVNQPAVGKPKSAVEDSLDNLRNIEYPPPHRWTCSERELLCVLNRFYQRQPHDFALIFNTLTDLDIRDRNITRQYDDYVRFHGPAAFPVYGEVQACPLSDPEGKYSAIRQSIEAVADELGIIVERQRSETPSSSASSSKSSTAKSARTRKQFKNLVRKARFRETPSESPIIQKPSNQEQPAQLKLGGFTIAIEEDLEVLVDIENTANADGLETILSPANVNSSLAFRVWDEDSWTVYDPNRGFIANGHTSWSGPLLPPFSPTTDKNALLFLTHLHMSKIGGGASGFVSVSRSLLQVINYGAEMKDPSIALINLNHPALKEENKKLEAFDVLKWLKKHGQAEWARYKGTTEAVFWSDIPNEAILKITKLSDLAELVLNVPPCANLLNLELFQPGRKVGALAKELGRRKLFLDREISVDMAKIARVMGLQGADIGLDHISDFLARLVDGWSIRYRHSDVKNLDGFAATFAIGLRSESHDLQGVSAAFVDGMKKGMASLHFYSPRDQRGKRKRSL